ncbi:uncharacterized protein PODANS_7_3870 [Podospora anserina S mat+]|uniref:Podospora anserina S mat+ genomic DNA chromosome 7, supercontig 1 n=1 Tax=Podospora anserina (strain S / ATCC MYA-4624 / DSM 980 / FGSC 10383) TaxID=515849 RepID=B2AV76_PODAN|nr:uncharacterized protein PODANS_7_3870 [Podospora anserina S mat+]CAP68299.1 unnamed protein product [Podospora anserina S mat+]CDP31770.1 Putative protein of unknown function [Podospora anserina S mat+]
MLERKPSPNLGVSRAVVHRPHWSGVRGVRAQKQQKGMRCKVNRNTKTPHITTTRLVDAGFCFELLLCLSARKPIPVPMDPEFLVKLLRAYDASFDAAAVRAAFNGSSTGNQFVQWATSHLTPDTLLTPDEFAQYAALEKAGIVDKLASSSDLAAVQGLTDENVRDAIEQLDRSTQAITKQTETLKQQREALDRLVAADRQTRQERRVFESEQDRKYESQRRDLTLAVRSETHTSPPISTLASLQTTGAGPAIQQTVDTLFRSDDKLLASLQKLGWELDTKDPEEQNHVVMLRETCARLDRIYLETLEEKNSGSSSRVSPGEVSSLQEEVESLYSEILPVAQMSVEQQFLEPALKKVEAKNAQEQAKSKQATGYVGGLDTAVGVLGLTAAQSEVATKVALATPRSRRPTVSQRGVMDSPVRPRPRHARRSSGMGGAMEESPLNEILRSLAISLPHEEEGTPDFPARARELASILAERRSKTEDIAKNVQESFDYTATRQIADGKVAIQLIRDSILAESPFGHVRLVDPEIESSIDVLSQELEKIRQEKEGLNNSMAKLRARSAKKDELIARWGS